MEQVSELEKEAQAQTVPTVDSSRTIEQLREELRQQTEQAAAAQESVHKLERLSEQQVEEDEKELKRQAKFWEAEPKDEKIEGELAKSAMNLAQGKLDYEKGLKLWDICRFGEAKETFKKAADNGFNRTNFYLCLYYLAVPGKEATAKERFEKVRADIETPEDGASSYMRGYVLQSKKMSKLGGVSFDEAEGAKWLQKKAKEALKRMEEPKEKA